MSDWEVVSHEPASPVAGGWEIDTLDLSDEAKQQIKSAAAPAGEWEVESEEPASPSLWERTKSAGKAAATVAGGMGEAALNKASQWVAPMVALPGQAIGELAGAISEGKTPQDVADSINMENARGFMERVGEASQAKTYQPQGEVGQGAVENFNEKIESVREPILDKVAEGAVKAGLSDKAAGFAISAADNTMMAAAYGLAGAPARVGAALERAVGAPKIKIGDVAGEPKVGEPAAPPQSASVNENADWSAYPDAEPQDVPNAEPARPMPQGEAAQPISVRPSDAAKLREEIAALRAEVPSGTPVRADSPLGKEIAGLKQRWQDAGLSPDEFYAIKPAEAEPTGAAEPPASAEPKAAPETPAAESPPVEAPTRPYSPLADDERAVAAQAAGIAPEAVDHDAVSALVHLIETDPATAQRMLDEHATSESLSAAVREHLAAKQHADEAGNDGESGRNAQGGEEAGQPEQPEQVGEPVPESAAAQAPETVAPQEAPDARSNEATSPIRSDQGEPSSRGETAGEGQAGRGRNVQQSSEEGDAAGRESPVSEQETQAGAGTEPDVAKPRRGTDARDTGHTPTMIRQMLVEQFHGRGIENLEKNGILKIVRSAEDLPAGAREGMTGSEDGVYHDGVAYLIANRLTRERAARTLSHEVGEHYGLEKMLGSEAYSRLIGEVRKWRNIRSPAVTEAWDAVKRAYPELDEADHTFVREVIAKLGESAAGRKTTVWKQIVQAIKQFFFKLGLPVELSEEDIAGLVRRSLGRAMKDERGEAVSERAEPAFSRVSEEGARLHAVKNEMVDEERASRGLQPIIGLAKESHGQWWDEAMRKMDENPLADRELVAELIDKPRGVDPVESSLLLHRRINLQNDYHKALALIDSGDEATAQEYSLRVAKIEDELDTLDAVSRGVGTEAGRALAVRKMLADEDYNVASMATAYRAAKGGEALTPKDREKIATHQKRIDRTRKVVEEVEANSEERAAKQQAAEVVQDLVQKAKQARGKSERRDNDAEKKAILAGIKHAVSESQKRMAADAVAKNAERGWKVPEAAVNKLAGIFSATKKPAKAMFSRGERAINESVDESVYAQVQPEFETYLKAAQDAGASVKDFTAGIVEQFGNDAVPYLAHFIKEKGLVAEIAPVREMKTPQRTQLSELGGYVQKLAEAFVRGGVTKLDPLVDAVHGELRKIVPDVTRRQTMDAISGYGEFSKLNPDPIKVVLRDLRGQGQQMAKLQDMEAGRPPKKTGVEQRAPSDEERRLRKQVHEAMKRLGIVITDPAKQLKSALASIETRLINEIKDLDFQIATGERTVKTHTESPTSPRIEELKVERAELRKQFDEIFKKPGLTDAQREKLATRALERSIERIEKRIASGDIAPAKKAAPVSTPALDARRAHLDALRAELQELRDIANPKKTPAERALANAIRTTKRNTARYQKMLADRQFDTPKREPKYAPDPELLKAKAELASAKKAWTHELFLNRLANRTPLQKIIGTGAEVLNTSRAVLTSLDLSAVLRQGGFVSVAHPIRAARSFPAMFKALRSALGAEEVHQEILSRPNYPLYVRAKLHLTESGGDSLTKMEEAYMSRWADKIPLVAGSQRAYVTFLNKLRADSFDAMAKSLSLAGKPTPEQASAIANFINVATGRGNFGMKENALVGLNTVFFAPRYAASRFQLLFGQPLYRGAAGTRMLIAKEYARYMVGLGMIYALGSMAGATIETDPRSSDFGKLRFGNTRLDPMSGLAQVTVLLSRLAMGETKSINSGKIVPIRGDKVPYGASDSSDVIWRFLRSKLAPIPSVAVNAMSGKDVVGNPVTAGSIAQGMVLPLAVQDVYSAMKEQGIPEGTALSLLALFGFGIQTFSQKQMGEKQAPREFGGTNWQYTVTHASLDKLQSSWDMMTPEQQETALPLIQMKIDNKIDRAKTPEEADSANALRAKFQIQASSDH